MAGPIVIGYDGTEGAVAALKEAVRLCGGLNTALVVVFGYALAQLDREVADHREAVRELGERETRAAIEKAAEAGVTAEAAVVPERPVDALVRVAEERDASMIVVGSYGERPLTGALLGSTPHKLLHLSNTPVLVVRA